MGNGQRYTRLPYPKQGTPASSPSLKEEGHPQAELGDKMIYTYPYVLKKKDLF
jgi:hypothetical protein